MKGRQVGRKGKENSTHVAQKQQWEIQGPLSHPQGAREACSSSSNCHHCACPGTLDTCLSASLPSKRWSGNLSLQGQAWASHFCKHVTSWGNAGVDLQVQKYTHTQHRWSSCWRHLKMTWPGNGSRSKLRASLYFLLYQQASITRSIGAQWTFIGTSNRGKSPCLFRWR